MNNYEFRFYYSRNKKESVYLGRYRVPDYDSFNFYINGINRGLSLSLWFCPEISQYPHGNVVLDGHMSYASEYENGTRFAAFYIDSIDRIKLLNEDEYNQIGRINQPI